MTPLFGMSLGAGIAMLVIYLGLMALGLWIGYLIMRTAVKNGTLLAQEELNRRAVAAEDARAARKARRLREEAQESAARALAEIRESRRRTSEAIAKRSEQRGETSRP